MYVETYTNTVSKISSEKQICLFTLKVRPHTVTANQNIVHVYWYVEQDILEQWDFTLGGGTQ